MPVSIKQYVTLDLREIGPVVPGQESVEVPTDALTAGTHTITVTCDNPNCKRGLAGSAKAISWDQSKAGADPNELPNDAFRVITIELFNQQKMVFCGKACAVEGVQSLVPLNSPREHNTIQFPESRRAPQAGVFA